MREIVRIKGNMLRRGLGLIEVGLGFCKRSAQLSAIRFQLLNIIKIRFQFSEIVIIMLYKLIMPVEYLLRQLGVFKLLLRVSELFFEFNIR